MLVACFADFREGTLSKNRHALWKAFVPEAPQITFVSGGCQYLGLLPPSEICSRIYFILQG